MAISIKKNVLIIGFIVLLIPTFWFANKVYNIQQTFHPNSCSESLPVSFSISLKRKDLKLGCNLIVKENGYYTVYIDYIFEPNTKRPFSDEFDKVSHLIQLQLDITDDNRKYTSSEKLSPMKIVDVVETGYRARISTKFLSAGKYQLVVTNLHAAPDMNVKKTEILISKSRETK